MTKFNAQSFFVVFIVLISVLVSSSGNKPETKPVPQEIFFETKQNVTIKTPTFNAVKKIDLLAKLKKPRNKSADIAAPQVTARAALVKFLNPSNETYYKTSYELNAAERWPLASLTKLMTAIVALEKIGKEKRIMITEEAITLSGTFKIFNVGDVFTVYDLIKTLLIVSRNDAATAMADFYGENNFIMAMREKAEELDMNETAFSDPTGLSVFNQSTIKDIEKLINYIINSQPLIFEIARQKEIEITEINTGKTIKLTNIIQFAGQNDFLGGKSGQTDEAKGNLVSLFEYKNRPLLIIVLGTEDRFGQTKILYEWAKLLIDQAM